MPDLQSSAIARPAPGQPAKIKLTNIEQRFRASDQDVLALTEVNLDIAMGEFLVLLGPSGCGKTTLLRIIAGLQKPTGGDVEISGLPLWKNGVRNDKVMEELGVVFQDANLLPEGWLFNRSKSFRGGTAWFFKLPGKM